MSGKKQFDRRNIVSAARVWLVLAFLIPVFGGCDNPYVQEILRGPTVLDNLTLHTEEQARLKLEPDFDSDILEYTAAVPYSAAVIFFEGIDHRDAEIAYSISADGVHFGEENTTGRFPFDKEVYKREAFVRFRVNRKYMDERIYNIHVIRISDAMLWDLGVRTRTSLPTDEGMFNALLPGYVPEKHVYTAKVNAQAEYLKLWSVRKKGVLAQYQYQMAGSAGYSGWIEIPAADEYTAEIPFPLDKESVTFRLKVELPEFSDIAPETYTVKAARPFQVLFDTTRTNIPNGFICRINGDLTRFAVGSVVSFTLIPPFGTKTKAVSYTYTGPAGETNTGNITPSPLHLYSLTMPEGDVTIYGEYDPVPYADHANVRYVYERGGNYNSNTDKENPVSGDALTWLTATRDLQALMDGYNADGTPGTGDDYEIWIAKGTYTPDWSTLPGGSWAVGLTDAQKNNPHCWAFVLTDGVKIYGGFDGTEETEAHKNNRNYTANRTVLSGSLGDKGTALHTLIAAGTGSYSLTARVEGLTVHGGYNVLGYSSSYPVNGVSISGLYGGVMYAVNSRPLFRNVDFDNGCTNYASGIAIQGGAAPVLVNCTVSRSQSSNYGSALSLLTSTSRLVMIGGSLSLNWDAGGVFSMTSGKALLVNTAIENNHENPVMISGGTGWFINTSITGNRGTIHSNADRTITTSTASGSDNARFYNSVVRDNFLQTYGAGVWFYDTVAPDINGDAVTINGTTSLSGGPLKNTGNNAHYPLNPDGTWNDSSPGYVVIVDAVGDPAAAAPGTWEKTVLDEIKAALLRDGKGRNRFNGTIDLGAAEE
jgi:hypothetical protein